MDISDFIKLLGKYGTAGLIIAVLMAVIVTLYHQQLSSLKDANHRADRAEAEIKSLNASMQQYLVMGLAVKQVMSDAAKEIRDT
jgi:hypothetical protein